MKKIVIDARESGTSSGRYTDKLLEYLHALHSNYNFTVLAKKDRVDFIKNIAPGFTVAESNYKEFTFDEQLRLWRQLIGLKPDLVHFPMVQQPVLYQGKVVTTMNDLTTARFHNPAKVRLVFIFKQWVYRWLNKWVARKSRALLTFTEYVKNDVVGFAGVDPAKVTVTLLAADPITEPPEPMPQLTDEQFIMYVGRPMPHKNLERLIEAFKLLRAQHPDLVLVLAGRKDVNYRRIEAAVQKAGIKNVLFTGFVSEGQLRWLYENCAAYVFPSLSEGFGLPGLEAMIHGAPVVSSNATCLPEIYGEAAHYFDPLNVQAMADAINEVLTDQELRQSLVEKGRAQAAKYSWKRMAEQTLAVYEKALEN